MLFRSNLPDDWAEKLSASVQKISSSTSELVEKISPSFEKLLKAVGRMHFTETDAKALTSVSPMISEMLRFSVSVLTMSAGEIVKQFMNTSETIDAEALKKKLQGAAGLMPTIVEGIMSSMPRILTTMTTLISKFAGSDMSTDMIKRGISVISSVSEVLTILPKMLGTIDSMR